MSEYSFKERFQIERLNSIEEKLSTPEGSDKFHLEKIHPYMFEQLLPLTEVAAAHALANLPSLTELLLMAGLIQPLCIDENAFEKITFLISQKEKGSFTKFNWIIELNHMAMKRFPEAAQRHSSFYDEFIKRI